MTSFAILLLCCLGGSMLAATLMNLPKVPCMEIGAIFFLIFTIPLALYLHKTQKFRD